MSGPDLHVHSTASDGTRTPSEIVSLAHRAGCPAIALTDHDTVGGVPEALAAASGLPLTVIPAVELSAGFGDRGMHILGYYIDHADARLNERLAGLRATRVERAERIVYALSRDGFTISVDEVLQAADGGSIGRAHIAQLLVATGQVPSVAEAFRTLLGKTAPYYVPKPVHDPAELIEWVRDAGGVPVLAHPGLSEIEDLMPALVHAGLAGIEVFHPSHDVAAQAHFAELASALGLVATGGSDFHGLDRDGDQLGCMDVPGQAVDGLERLRGRAR
jgi:hypothetical protein